jgi:hypothetical protein
VTSNLRVLGAALVILNLNSNTRLQLLCFPYRVPDRGEDGALRLPRAAQGKCPSEESAGIPTNNR